MQAIKKNQYQNLIGKNEISKMMGEEFNFYPAEEWTYHLKTDWFGRKKLLFLHFEKDLVRKIEIKKTYR